MVNELVILGFIPSGSEFLFDISVFPFNVSVLLFDISVFPFNVSVLSIVYFGASF